MSKTLHLRRLLALFIILSAAALAITVFRYFSKSAHKENRRLPLQRSIDLALKTIHFTESAGEGVKWELFAASGTYDKSAELSTLQDIRFVVKQSERYGNLVVTAKEGQYAHTAKKLTLAGAVLAKNDKGASFETARIAYDSGKKLFNTAEKVRLTDGAMTVEGKGMELSLAQEEAKIMSEVTATILPGKLAK